MPSLPPPPPFVPRLPHLSPGQPSVDVQKVLAQQSSSPATESMTISHPASSSVSAKEPQPLPSDCGQTPHQIAGPDEASQLQQATPPTACTTSILTSAAPSAMDKYNPHSRPSEAEQATREKLGQAGVGLQGYCFPLSTASTSTSSSAPSTLNRHDAQTLLHKAAQPSDQRHGQPGASSPPPSLGIVSAFMSGSASAGGSAARSLPTQSFFSPTQPLGQASSPPPSVKGDLHSLPNGSTDPSSNGNALHLASLYTPRDNRWSRQEDLLLLSSVKQHGERWKQVAADVNAGGGRARSAGATCKRYERLQSSWNSAVASLVTASGFSATAASTSSFAGQQHQQQQPCLPSLAAVPAAADLGATASSTTSSVPTHHSQKQQVQQKKSKHPRVQPTVPTVPRELTLKPWSPEEDEILTTVRKNCKRVKDVFPAFRRAMPGTKRTASAVQTRWVKTLLPKQEEEREGEAAKEGGSRSRTHTPATPAFSAVDDSIAPSEQDASSRATREDASEAAAPAVNYSIETLPNGYVVRHLPPWHELHIHSPTLCQVVKVEAAASPSEVKVEDEDQKEQQEPPMAPFVFRVGPSGFITALKLPVGTETSIAFDDESGEEGEVVETSFETIDGYNVTFLTQSLG